MEIKRSSWRIAASPFSAIKCLATWGALSGCLMIVGTYSAWAQTLPFDQQVNCQTAIEEIRWAHTFWPEANTRKKPPLSDILSGEKIASRVTETLRMSAALEQRYGVHVDARQLQSELDRMAVATRAPDQLQEMYEALDNDAQAVADCLVRPRLTREHLRRAYAWDRDVHASTRAQARSDAANLKQTNVATDAEIVELTYVVGDDNNLESIERGDHKTMSLSPEEWAERLEVLNALEADSQVGLAVRETEDAFILETVVEQQEDRFTVRSHLWPKQPFELWWQGESGRFAAESTPTRVEGLVLTEITGEVTDRKSMSGDPSFDTWRHERFAPTPLVKPTAVWTGEEMIVWGSDPTNRGYRYSPATDSWTITSQTNAPSARNSHTAIWTGGEMIVWGGVDVGHAPLNTGGRYDPVLDQWSEISTQGAPVGAYDHTAVWTGEEMIVWGGYGSSNAVTNKGGRYDPQTDSWTPTSLLAGVPGSRAFHAAVWTGDRMIIWGGLESSDTGGIYDPQTDSWSAPSLLGAPSPRVYVEAVWTGSEMIIWGGASGGTSGGRYNPQTDTWQPTSTGPHVPNQRIWHTVVWTGTEMIVWGGRFGADNVFNTGARYHPESDTWQPLPLAGAPDAREDHAAVWTGDEMIVWGGYSPFATHGSLNSGGRYYPDTDNWQPTSVGAPRARSSHESVWTGTQMIAWGGAVNSWVSPTGAVYDAITATWSPTSLLQAPSMRFYHTVVWTGEEMIVWGGSAADYLNTGARYQPLTDSWSSTSITAQTPSAREAHTSVWTGDEMIVWGGYAEVDQNDGARYDPSSDAWSAISNSGAPAPRGRHTAIWGGGEMIVWGGIGVSNFNDGARYSPLADSWSPIPVESATPSARYLHAAVWTGNEMIIWGGYDGADSNSGARYSPSENAWTVLPVDVHTPSSRYGFTSIWAGKEMIVWGGQHLGQDLATGGRFDPIDNLWRPTIMVNAPEARSFHSAVWTGSEMFIWGAGGSNLPDLSVYAVAPISDVIFAHDFELPDEP